MMKKNRILRALVFLGWIFLPGMDWPAPGAVMTGNFGWNDRGWPRLGAVFEGEGPVLAAEDGELIFYRDEDDSVCRLPSPLGAWMALDHGDGIISIYGRLEVSEAGDPPAAFSRNGELARMGRTGWAEKTGLYFALFDRKERRWVNPSMIISPLEDTRPPQIRSVRLQNAEGLLIDPQTARTISQGRYTVSVEAVDTLKEGDPQLLAPHRLICSVNGAEIGVLNFETYSARDGTLMVYRNGMAPAREVYAPYPAFEVGELWLTRGQANLEIIAQDRAGNTRNAVFRLIVE
jgi:hypothetical protein